MIPSQPGGPRLPSVSRTGIMLRVGGRVHPWMGLKAVATVAIAR